jgi:outer membrane immunogenic protein
VLGLAASQAASAADLPARPVYKAPVAVVAATWSGVYVGGNVGAAWDRNCWTFNPSSTNDNEGCHNATGVIAGGQIGVNWQTGNVVFGLEASGDWADLKGSNVSLAFPGATNQTKTDAIALFTGRVGLAWANAVLAYVKGGGALTHNKYTAFTTATPGVFNSASDTRWGWTVGAGLEYAFAPNWSVGVEYDYVDTGSRDLTFTSTTGFGCAAPCVDRISQRIHMAMLRLNYRFGPWR